ncbi:flagellin N-terminal helical domain-containing protein [Proteocatella sphenisci]|uniref:flagellin N-terminal helical domain-containing protein n=1 Tax=Proteocatella sphenisci TaxID=181070 RepID=UPI00048E6E84|nr:flagellin [Proteocatella sphenisci]
MRIQNNIMAMNAHRALGNNNNATSKSLEKLSSGFKINRAGDDAAGLAISEKMRSQIKGLETAQANANDGISLVQTAEGALTEVHSMLNRMTELATKSANGTMQNEVDRDAIQSEFKSLSSEIDRISKGTNFNGINLIDGSIAADVKLTAAASGTAKTNGFSAQVSGMADGAKVTFAAVAGTGADSKVTAAWAGGNLTITINSAAGAATGAASKITQEQIKTAVGAATGTAPDNKSDISVKIGSDITFTAASVAAADIGNVTAKDDSLDLQVGDTADDFQKVSVGISDMGAEGLGISNVDLSTQAGAAEAIGVIKNAINTVSTNRANLGAVQNRLEHTVNNLGVTTENITAAESRIRDVDMAKEMMTFTKNNILSQAAQSMLAQANQQPQGVLQLLR